MSQLKKNYLLDIKSLFIISTIFSLLNERQKLNFIIYNKKLQEKLEIIIEIYKKISGGYKIAEKKMEKEKNILLKIN